MPGRRQLRAAIAAGRLLPGAAAGRPGSPHLSGTAILRCRERGYAHFTDGETEARRSRGACICTQATGLRASAVPASLLRTSLPEEASAPPQQLRCPEVPRGSQAACVTAAGPGAPASAPAPPRRGQRAG